MTVIASYGMAGSNSYIGLTEANSFITTSVVDPSAWTSASTVQREAALIEATRDIDSRNYRGGRYYYDQELEFPRAFESGWPYNRTSLATPNVDIDQVRAQHAVEKATCYQAMWLLRNSGRNYHAERIASGIKSFSESVGPISESASYAGVGGIERMCPDSLATLAPYLVGRQAVRG